MTEKMTCACGARGRYGTRSPMVRRSLRHPFECPRFRCSGCRRWQPWCRGADDATPTLCDACAPTARAA